MALGPPDLHVKTRYHISVTKGAGGVGGEMLSQLSFEALAGGLPVSLRKNCSSPHHTHTSFVGLSYFRCYAVTLTAQGTGPH